jgi:hypothetical protein
MTGATGCRAATGLVAAPCLSGLIIGCWPESPHPTATKPGGALKIYAGNWKEERRCDSTIRSR